MGKDKKIRVRFAPSPTGFLHVGSLRTALYNYLFAKKNGGDFLLRIEDTDQKRYVEGAVAKLIDSLEWAGLEWDEGIYKKLKVKSEKLKIIESKSYPGIVEAGDYGPYVQSERLEIYQKYAKQLVKEGKAYYCFCEPERLEEMRKKQKAEKKAPLYDRYCLKNLKDEEVNEKIKENCPHTIRLKIPENEEIEFDDLIRGKMKFNSSVIDDQILLKSDGYPTYHLANVADDHLMEITHVIRGDEWLSSTPKHILLYRAFGWEMPEFAHIPLLLNPDKSKLSKRQGDVSVEDYIQKGYLKDAMINFVAFLGWNPGKGSVREVFSLKELVQNFDLQKVHKAGAVFDIKKLDWLNSEYIKKMPVEKLHNESLKFFEQKDFFAKAPEKFKTEEYLKKVLSVEKERLAKLSEAGESNRFFFEETEYDKNLLSWKNMQDPEIKNQLQKAKEILGNIPENNWTKENLEKILMEAAGERRGEFLWPLRAALTGTQKSPSPFEVVWVLGREESLARIEKALVKLD